MQIPLDYYRILGVFPQVADEQLSQAYQDRRLQLPRREYSEEAITSRKQLLDQAYEVLSDPEKRAVYENLFVDSTLSSELTSTPEVPSRGDQGVAANFPTQHSSTLDIAPRQLVGALIILQELGEYELVIKFGETYLQTLVNSPIDSEESRAANKTDIVLTVALAALELSREQWQQEEYEQAAMSGYKGLNLLQKNYLFPPLQSEITSELYKLRPYRVLELLAQPEKNRIDRDRGKVLLKAMLQERQGIEGQGNDHSGLNIDDFLRFIQQLRTYLTAQEQQELFCTEAHRPSAVAAYLGVYALIACGLAKKQPALIIEAQTILDGLGQRQDVALEQAICALLLGQTQEASLAIERCQDKQALTFIQQQSRGAPDLLPGLYLYGEHWLQTEVFSHFRDLSEQTVSLGDYFADETIQSYLEQLSLDAQGVALEEQQEKGATMAKSISQSNRVLQERRSLGRRRRVASGRSQHQEPQLLASGGGGVTALATAPAVPMAPRRRSSRNNNAEGARDRFVVTTSYRQPQTAPKAYPQRQLTPLRKAKQPEKSSRPSPRRTKPRKTTFKPRPWFVLVSFLGALGILGLSVKWLQYTMSPLAALEEEQLVLELRQPPIEIPETDTSIDPQTGKLTPEGAKELVKLWLSSKADAFGKNHQVESLRKILDTSVLPLWEDRARKLQQSQNYWQYKHEVAIKSLKVAQNNSNQDQATVDASVREVADFYQDGQRNGSRSYDDQLQVRYELRRDRDRWLIQSLKVIN